ncbi:hypothetical protein EK21DRAFT_111420 [Setomelanomma holmii]|uniref:Uncharacterized protein n=1 Tax=Setomelanomma holmii TaxID=210430 RepID=A0A9P4H9U0_9PLEO|nr:hypothetical protein EK21DRAFT_111420 [Setomelanomma holmii]
MDTGVAVMEFLHEKKPFSDDLDYLRTIHRNIELALWKLHKVERTLEASLRWLEEAVAGVSQRSDLDGVDALASKYSREGSLLRIWLQTFPEAEALTKSKGRFIEWYVEILLDVERSVLERDGGSSRS